MKRCNFVVRLTFAGILCAAGTLAHAGLLSAVGGNPLTTGSNNDVLGAGVTGTIGSSLMLAGPASLTYTYLGKEAAWSNRFTASGDSGSGSFATGSTTAGASFSVSQAGAGLLDFDFWTPAGAVTNAANRLTAPHFFLQLLDGNSAILALDDGGAGPDCDYDDLVVRVSATGVPEPGSLVMLGAGLVCLVAVRRRTSPAIR